MVAGAYQLGDALGEPVFAARGELGRIWCVPTSTGRWAVKELLSPNPGDGQVDARFQFAAAEARVPLPRPVRTPGGEVVTTVGGATIRVYEWVDLDTTATVVPRKGGELLARLHAVRHRASSIDLWYTEPVGEESWRDVVARGHRADRAWAAPLEALIPHLLTAEAVILDALQTGGGQDCWCCHLDFNPQNVAMTAGGTPVVLDWENAGAAIPEREVAQAVWDFAAWPGRSDRARAALEFVAGYRQAGGVFDPSGVEVFAMAFALQGHLLEHYARRTLDGAATPEDRERANGWLAEMTACPLTVEQAIRLLATVNGHARPR
jgi:Ser/Thr protein kinase RdoA (MazF antagonist)